MPPLLPPFPLPSLFSLISPKRRYQISDPPPTSPGPSLSSDCPCLHADPSPPRPGPPVPRRDGSHQPLLEVLARKRTRHGAIRRPSPPDDLRRLQGQEPRLQGSAPPQDSSCSLLDRGRAAATDLRARRLHRLAPVLTEPSRGMFCT